MRLLQLDRAGDALGEVPETDLVIYGLLPALAISTAIATVLSLFGLFRTTVFAAVMIFAVLFRWRDAIATLAALFAHARTAWRSLARGELMTLVAILIFSRTALGLAVYAQVPNINVDVWHHQVPLAQSIVDHAGFVTPQIDNMFYGTLPIFFNVLFAQAFLFVDNAIAADVANSLLYLGFLLSLLFCARRARAVAAFMLSILIINSEFFTAGAASAMTDLPRTCFTVLALVFTYRYLRDQRLYFLFAAGLLAGGAVAGKYTELLTPVLIGLSLSPRLLFDRRGWIAVGIFAAAFLPLACYPYLRNWILLDNPVYPFFFAHPGLSDAYVAQTLAENRRPFDPANRIYVTNLLSLMGWHDFFTVVYRWFFLGFRNSYYALALICAGLCFRGSRIAYLVLWAFLLAIAWYTIMFNSVRYALPFYLTLLSGGFLAGAWLIDRLVSHFEPLSCDWQAFYHGMIRRSWFEWLPRWLTPDKATRAALALLALLYCISIAGGIHRDGLAALMPQWADKQLGAAALEPGGIEAYLNRNLKGYQIYRLIASQDLKMVMQPFDNGAVFYQAAYNGGRNNGWILPHHVLPDRLEDFESFLSRNGIRYFIYRPTLSLIELERLGPDQMKTAYALVQQIMPRSHRIFVDAFGWELYALDETDVPMH